MSRLTRGWLGSLLLAVLGVGGTIGIIRIRNLGPPRGMVIPSEMRLNADQNAIRLATSFRIINRGGGVLKLGEPSTTCGCTVASVSSKVVTSGAESIVEVIAEPPSIGEKLVEVHIPTQGSSAEELVFRLTLVGAGKPPIVTTNSGVVQFGAISSNLNQKTSLFVETREVSATKPWISRVTSSLPASEIKGGVEKTIALPGGIVFRRYVFTLMLNGPLLPGSFSGEVGFASDDSGTPSILSLPVRGEVLAPVYATPSSLYANWDPSQDEIKFRLCIAAADKQFELEATPVQASLGDVEVHRASRDHSRIFFEVTLRKHAKADMRTKLRFTTNDPSYPEIVIPLTLNVLQH